MASIVKGTEQYFNRYEAAYNRLKGTNQFFEDSDWQYLQDLGNMDNINMYITGSEKLQKEGYTAEQIFGTGPNNSNTRFMSIITEAFLKDDKTVKTHFVPWSPEEVTKLKEEAAAYEEQYKADARDRVRTGEKMYEYDNKALNTLNLGGKEEKLTEYEYMKRLIQNEQLTIDNEHWNQFTRETKDLNFWTKLGGGALSVLANMGIGADMMLSTMAATFVHGGSYLFVDIWNDIANGNTKNLDYRLRMIDEQSKGTLTNAEIAGRSFQDVMIDFESDYTNFRDEYGNLTTAGQIFVNAARTAGEMMAASFIGGGLARQLGAVSPTYAFAADGTFKMMGYSSKTAKLGKFSFDLARIVGTTTYYAPMAARSMAANYVELSAADPSIHTGTIVAHSITATAAEIAIEVALGQLVGDTKFNRWLLGGGKPNPKIVKNFAGYLGTYAKDIFQEGTEELLQEFSNIAIDNAFGKAVNENFGQLSELTWQSASNAFIIGALVSAGHAAVDVVSEVISTSPLTVVDGEGNKTQLSRLQSVVYGYNLKTYSQSVKDASTKMADALDRMYKALPVSEQIVYLTEELSEAEDELKRYEAVSEIGKKTGLSDETVSEIAGIEIDEETESAEPKDSSKMGQYRAELREVKKANLEQNVKRIKSELARLKKESSKEQNAIKKGVTQGDKKSRKTAKELRAVKQDFVDAFSAMVASSRMIQAFSSEIGAEQVAKAEELLTAMTKKIRAEDGGSKLDPEYIAKSLEEMTSVLRLKGIHISKKDIEKLKKSGNTKLLEMYGLNDVAPKESKKPGDTASPEEKERQRKVIADTLLKDSKAENIVVTEDGTNAVELEDGKTIVVPNAEIKLGAIEVFKDLAEQKLVETLIAYPFKGNVITKIVETYQNIYGKDKTVEEAIYEVCFNKTFFVTMLGTENKKLADRDMFQFLSSLQELFDTIVPDDVKTQIYKDRVSVVKTEMTEALFEYAKLQPNAELRLDIFTSQQKAELIQLHEAGEFANRIVTGKYTPSDWKLIEQKVAASNLPESTRKTLLETLKSNKPTKIRNALRKLDEQYEILFDGAHNGKIYLPETNKRNAAFNHFLYTKNLTINTFFELSEEEINLLNGKTDQVSIVQLRNEQLLRFTNGAYSLVNVSVNAGSPDPRNGTFQCDTQLITVKRNAGRVGKKRNIEQLIDEVALNSDVEKTTIYRDNKNTELVNSILAPDVPKGYYTIDDVISNTYLLSDEIKNKITEEYGEVNDETAYLFLKTYFLENTKKISLSLTQNNEVVFVNISKTVDLIDRSKLSNIKSGETTLADLVKPQYRIPILRNVVIVLSPTSSSLSAEQWHGEDVYKLRLSRKALNSDIAVEHLAHEAQHAIQIANKLNFGNDSNILSMFNAETKTQIIQDVKVTHPELFEDVTVPEGEDVEEYVVNNFLYTASGEIEAYGQSQSKAIDFYPVIVKLNNDKTLTITLPSGNSYKTSKAGQVGAMDGVDMNQATYKGKDFWLGVTDLNGNIVKTWTYAEAEAKGFDLETEAIFNNQLKDGYRFFTTDLIEDNGQIERDDYGDVLPENIIKRLNEQITIKSTATAETVNEAEAELLFADILTELGATYKGTFKEFSQVDENSLDPIASLFTYLDDVFEDAYNKSRNEGLDESEAEKNAFADPKFKKLGSMIDRLADLYRSNKIYKTINIPDVNTEIDAVLEKKLRSAEREFSRIAALVTDYSYSPREANKDDYAVSPTEIINPLTGEVIDISTSIDEPMYQHFDNNGNWVVDNNVPEDQFDYMPVMKKLINSLVENPQLLDLENPDFYKIFVEATKDFLIFDYRVHSDVITSVIADLVSAIHSIFYGDTFYSQMIKAVEGMKDGKHGAQSIIPYLKDQKRGVKNEEIKWSGLEEFLEGKKSVTKEELLEFCKNSMLEVTEEKLSSSNTRWHKYSVLYEDKHPVFPRSYREIVFRLTGNEVWGSYTNKHMTQHWGSSTPGVMAHARVHDRLENGKYILFIDELQSDWHNEANRKTETGEKIGYRNPEDEQAIEKLRSDLKSYETKKYELELERTSLKSEILPYLATSSSPFKDFEAGNIVSMGLRHAEGFLPAIRKYDIPHEIFDKIKKLSLAYSDVDGNIERLRAKLNLLNMQPPIAPFSETYHEYVMKRLIRLAAERGYDAIAWTHSDTQMARWNPTDWTNAQMAARLGEPVQGDPEAVAYQQAYANLYDKRMPKIADKIGGKFGAKVKAVKLADAGFNDVQTQLDDLELELTDRWGITPDIRHEYDETGHEITVYENSETGEIVSTKDLNVDRYHHNNAWYMDINKEMRESVIFEGQPLYTERISNETTDIDEKTKAKLTENGSLEDLKTLFKQFNEDKEVDKLFDKVYGILTKLQGRDSYSIHFRDYDPEFEVSIYNGNKTAAYVKNKSIVYDSSYLTDANVDPQYRATVILHEMVHAVTLRYLTSLSIGISSGYAIDPVTNDIVKISKSLDIFRIKPNQNWTEGLKGALALMQIYEQMKTGNAYGDMSVDEFVAELANPYYRNELKKRSLWTKILDCIKRILGLTNNDALSAATTALDKILTSYDAYKPTSMPNINAFSIIGQQTLRRAPAKRGRKTTQERAANTAKLIKSKQGAVQDYKNALKNINSGNYQRKVSEADGYNTNLRAFKNQQLSKELRGFILEAWYTNDGGVNKGIWDHILHGTLTRTEIYDFLYNMSDNKRNNETFRLINKHFFKNSHIDSIKELDEKVEQTNLYYGMYMMFVERKLPLDLLQKDDPKVFKTFMGLLDNDPGLRKSFESFAYPPLERTDKFETVPELLMKVDPKQLRRLWLKSYNGDVYSIGTIVRAALTVIGNKYQTSTKINTESLSKRSQGKEGEGHSLGDRIRAVSLDNSSADDKYYVRLYSETDELYEDSEDAIAIISSFGNNMAEIRRTLMAQYAGKIDDKAFEEGLKRIAFILETTGKKGDVTTDSDLIAAVEEANQRLALREPRNVVQNIKRLGKTITEIVKSDRMSIASRKAFLADNKELFNDEFELRPDAYSYTISEKAVRYLADTELLELEKYLKELKQNLKVGVYDKSYQELSKSTKEYHKLLLKAIDEFAKGKPTDIHISNDTIIVNNGREMPKIIDKLINTELTKYAPTRVQLVSEENEVHIKMSMSRFINDNIDILNGLTQAEVDEVIDYYVNTSILPETNRAKLYLTVEQFMLGYLWKANEEGKVNFALTSTQIDKIQERLSQIASIAGTAETNWREVLRSMNLMRERASASLKFYNDELSEDTKKEVIKAIASNDPAQVAEAKAKAYNELKEKYSLQSTTFWEKAIRLQRIMMLSSPATWVRNWTSNLVIGGIKTKEGKVIIPGLDVISEVLNLLPSSKAAKRLAAKDLKADGTPKARKVYTQYKIAGTKVTEEYRNFIKTQLLDSGFLNNICDGLTKYDPRKPVHSGPGHETILELIQESIMSKLFDERHIGQKIISVVMSDKKAVMKTMLRYLGKMLTEDQVDISKGINNVVQEYISEAYVAAAHDFMHRPDFFSKIEFYGKNLLRSKLGETGGDAVYFLYKQVLPFASSSWNWFVDKLNYTPLGLCKSLIDLMRIETLVDKTLMARSKGIKTRSQRFTEYIVRRNITKGVIGSVLWVIGTILVATGKAGVDEEDDKYKLWAGSGTDRVYIDLSNIHGTSSLVLGMAVADSFISKRDGTFNLDKFIDIICDVGDEMLNDFVLADVYNTFRRYDSPTEIIVNQPLESISMFMPKFLSLISSAFRNKRIKYSSGLKGKLEKLAGSIFDPLSVALGATYWTNPYTGEVELINKSHWLTIINKASPVKVNQYAISLNEQEAIMKGVRAGSLTGAYTVNDEKVSLSADELAKLNQLYGQLNKKDLDKLFDSKIKYKVQMPDGTYKELTYKKMSDKQKKAVIERVMSNNSQIAKIYILTSSGRYKYYASESEYTELRKAGITKNVYRKTNKLTGFVKI